MTELEVRPTALEELPEALALLDKLYGRSEPVSPPFIEWLRASVERGDLEVLAARIEGRLVGVAVLAFRPSFSAGALFTSIEDLYVREDARGRGVGRALVEAVEERCKGRGVSYVEVQTDDEAAPFYEALGYEPEVGVRVLSRYITLSSRSLAEDR